MSGRPRLLILTPDFPPAPGGIQLMAHRFAAGIASFQTRVVTLQAPGGDAFDRDSGCAVRRVGAGALPRGARGALLNGIACADALGFRPDVTLCMHIVASPAAAAIRAALGAPSVQYFHAEEIGARPKLAAFAVRHADEAIAVSAYTAGLVLATGATPASLRLIPPGVDIPSEASREALARPTFVTVARLEERYKGHDVLVRALALVRAKVPDVQWVVVGDGSLRPGIEALARSYDVLDSILFLGAVTDEQRNLWLRRAHLLAMPSRLPAGGFAGEGFGIALLEAGAHGKPVVAGNVGGAIDSVSDGESGLLVDPLDPVAVAEAITRLLGDPELAARLGAAAQQRAQGFAWPLIVERLEAVLHEQLARPRRRVGFTRRGIKVLYVNHTSEISGGERSLLSLLGALPDSVEPLVAAPPGPLQSAVEDLGIPVTSIAGTAGSLRLHPLHTPQALAEMALAALQVRRAARRSGAAVVHANSIRAGIVLALARPRRAAAIVHVRDCLPPGRLTSATMRLIAAGATTILANSRYTARSVEAAAPSARPEVIHNPVDLERWDPDRIDRDAARAALGEALADRLLLGVVAQLTPWKGQDTAIEALGLLCEEGRDAHLLLIGSAKFLARSTRFDNERYLARLHELVAQAGIEQRVSWLGEREDVPELMRALDVLLLPSWEEPFGRALIEAMALGVPVVATNVGGPPEILSDGQEGFLLPPRQPAAWAQAVGRLADDPDRAAAMGAAGRRRVRERFTIAEHLASVLALYERAMAAKDLVSGP